MIVYSYPNDYNKGTKSASAENEESNHIFTKGWTARIRFAEATALATCTGGDMPNGEIEETVDSTTDSP